MRPERVLLVLAVVDRLLADHGIRPTVARDVGDADACGVALVDGGGRKTVNFEAAVAVVFESVLAAEEVEHAIVGDVDHGELLADEAIGDRSLRSRIGRVGGDLPEFGRIGVLAAVVVRHQRPPSPNSAATVDPCGQSPAPVPISCVSHSLFSGSTGFVQTNSLVKLS